MQKDKLKQILIYVIPFIAFIVIFGFALACGAEPPTEEVSKAEEETEVAEEAKTEEVAEEEEIKEEPVEEVEKEIIEVIRGEEPKTLTLNQAIEYKVSDYNVKGELVEIGRIRVSSIDYKFTDSFKGDISSHEAPEGAKYFWVYLKAENIGEEQKLVLPLPNDFTVLYKDEPEKMNQKR